MLIPSIVVIHHRIYCSFLCLYFNSSLTDTCLIIWSVSLLHVTSPPVLPSPLLCDALLSLVCLDFSFQVIPQFPNTHIGRLPFFRSSASTPYALCRHSFHSTWYLITIYHAVPLHGHPLHPAIWLILLARLSFSPLLSCNHIVLTPLLFPLIMWTSSSPFLKMPSKFRVILWKSFFGIT